MFYNITSINYISCIHIHLYPDWVNIYFRIEKDLENNTGTVVTFQMERGS